MHLLRDRHDLRLREGARGVADERCCRVLQLGRVRAARFKNALSYQFNMTVIKPGLDQGSQLVGTELLAYCEQPRVGLGRRLQPIRCLCGKRECLLLRECVGLTRCCLSLAVRDELRSGARFRRVQCYPLGMYLVFVDGLAVVG